MRSKAFELAGDERMLLRAAAPYGCLCYPVADPDDGIDDLRLSDNSGGSAGFVYACTRVGIEGTWNEIGPDPDRPGRYRTGPVLRRAAIRYPRLRAWVVSLPADVRAQALVWWRVHPVETRDIPRLHQLILAQLTDPVPDDEPTDLLGLLDHLDKETP